jgi:Family of unknown function (DUF5343)
MLELTSGEAWDDKRPYAPAANVLAVIERVRRLNLPAVVDTDFLRLADVPEGSLGRVAFALRFLGLTDTSSRPTDQLRAIARATDEEYRELLAGAIQSAYATDFARVDPSVETQAKIVSAFQRYEPRSQTTRMVMLFLGLAKAAGIPVLEAPRERGLSSARVAPGRGGSVRPKPSPAGAKPRVVSQAPAPAATPSVPAEGLLFGVTVDDIAALPEADFKDVWDALGKVALARARSMKALQDMADQASRRAAAEGDEGG